MKLLVAVGRSQRISSIGIVRFRLLYFDIQGNSIDEDGNLIPKAVETAEESDQTKDTATNEAMTFGEPVLEDVGAKTIEEEPKDAGFIPARSFTLLVGDPMVGPTLVEVRCEATRNGEDWLDRDWNRRRLAVVGECKVDEGLISDAYMEDNLVLGASASASVSVSREVDKDGGVVAVALWEFSV